MRKLFFLISFIIVSFAAKAQTLDAAKNDTAIYTSVNVEPTVQGGFGKLFSYIQSNLKYPKIAKKNNTQGTVRIKFVIERDGSLSDIKVEKSLSADTDAEAIRLINNPKAPKWIAGTMDSKPVRVQYSIPIYFKLDN